MFTLRINVPNSHSFNAKFSSVDQAIDYIERKPKYYIDEQDDALWLPRADRERLMDALHPSCEHGMSLDLCAGPQHYGYDDDEARAYGF